MNTLQAYYDGTQKPWGQLFYRQLHERLRFLRGARVLDFGSGFGFTAGALAEHNAVLAIEPSADMCAMRGTSHVYEQRTGGIEIVRELPAESFDALVLHNVLEYVDDKEALLAELLRVLRPGGLFSLVGHNRTGRIMARAVYEQNPALAMQELHGLRSQAQHFGDILHYGCEDVARWCDRFGLLQEGLYGVRIFYGLGQNNAVKEDPAWQEASFALEWEVAALPPYRDIAFYHHRLLRKK